MNTSTTLSLSGRVDVHRLDELRSFGSRPTIDASGIEFLDIHAIEVLEELGATLVAPSAVARLTLELTQSPLPCFAGGFVLAGAA